MKPSFLRSLAVTWTLIRKRYVRRAKERKERVRGVPKNVSDSKKVEGENQVADRRLSERGIWQRLLPPGDRVRILKIGVQGKGTFKGSRIVRLKPVEGGKTVNYREDDFLVLFEPVLSAVRED